MKIIKIARPFYKKYIAKYFAKKRIVFFDSLCNHKILSNNLSKIKILEVGCGIGEDFISHLGNRTDLEIYGIDVNDRIKINQKNFTFILGDAEKINYPDNFFDITVSFGVFEHIIPIEKLSRVIKEIDRVSKSYYHEVPAISTFIESHTNSFLWQLRDFNKKDHPSFGSNAGCFFLSDEGWMQFEGFNNVKVVRYSYIPFFMKSLILYKNEEIT